jgi:hypothetical protein
MNGLKVIGCMLYDIAMGKDMSNKEAWKLINEICPFCGATGWHTVKECNHTRRWWTKDV